MGTDLDQFPPGEGNTSDVSFTRSWSHSNDRNSAYMMNDDGKDGWDGMRQIFCKQAAQNHTGPGWEKGFTQQQSGSLVHIY